MQDVHSSVVVNSHNEWDSLEEVIVGAGIPETLPAIDLTFKMFFHDNIQFSSEKTINSQINKRHICEHNEDIENFALLLKSLDVIVKRPKTPRLIQKVTTPNWSSQVFPALNVRDLTLIVGDEIIETPVSCRWRYYETDYLKHLFLEYFNSGAKWTSAPRPILTDYSFDMSHILQANNGQVEELQRMPSFMDCGNEIMFDAANIMRFGTHLLFNTSSVNMKKGIEWLRRHLGNKYTVWECNITDNHIDSCILPLKPGLCLITRDDIWHLLPPELQKWDKILIVPKDRSKKQLEKSGIKLASSKIELNVFSVSPELIICHPEYEDILNKKLKPYNITAIGSQIRHCEIFSGAHHCTTLDIRRKSKLVNYFQ